MKNKIFIKYLISGIASSLVFYISANILKMLNINSTLSTLFGNIVSCIFGFYIQMQWTFKVHYSGLILGKYAFVLVLIFIYAQIIVYIFSKINFALISAFIASSIPLFSYPLQKYWVFKKQKVNGGGRSENTLNPIFYLDSKYSRNYHPLFYSINLFYFIFNISFLDSKYSRKHFLPYLAYIRGIK